jgi:hypothetical protein
LQRRHPPARREPIVSFVELFQIPAGTFHAYRITSDLARVIIVTSPGGAADFFRDADSETDMQRVVGIALRHGFTLPPPPHRSGSMIAE